jgi:type IV pilus assembly protein PilW
MKTTSRVRRQVRLQRVLFQRGLSLVELMISMTLGLLIILAVTYVFAGSRANYRHQEALSAVQESGRIALESLSRDIRMAGYPGCGSLAFLQHLSPTFSNDTAIAGTPAAAAAVPDAISVTRGSANLTSLASMPAANELVVTDFATLGGAAAGPILITDCAYTEVLQISGVSTNTITASSPLARLYGAGSLVMRLESVAYSVAGNELIRNGQAVAGSVTNMKIFYGVDNNGDRAADVYVSNPGALIPAGWPRVVSVRINLTVTEQDITMPFSATVALRNRAP